MRLRTNFRDQSQSNLATHLITSCIPRLGVDGQFTRAIFAVILADTKAWIVTNALCSSALIWTSVTYHLSIRYSIKSIKTRKSQQKSPVRIDLSHNDVECGKPGVTQSSTDSVKLTSQSNFVLHQLSAFDVLWEKSVE